MIAIESLRISPDLQYLEFIGYCDADKRITELKIKTQNTYDTSEDLSQFNSDGTGYLDLSSELSKESNYETLRVSLDTIVTEDDSNVLSDRSDLSDLLFVYIKAERPSEFQDVFYDENEIPASEETLIAICSLSHFYLCLMEKISKLKDRCETCFDDVELQWFLLKGLENAIKLNVYDHAIDFYNELSNLCDYGCLLCDQESNTSTRSGIGVWVLNDTFIVQ